jgi:uncharacterized repeat protein (TIGR03803 family)
MKNEKIVLSTIAYCQRLKSFRTRAALVLTTLVLVVAATTGATAQTFTTLDSFDGTDGSFPYAGLAQAGNLYGTTVSGGANGEGTVFTMTQSGNLTTLHSFLYYTDGELPYAGLVQGRDGNFYGTTYAGGTNNAGGTIFKITPSGKLTALYSFCSEVVNGNCTDGSSPDAGLVQDTFGNFYGTTSQGGASGNCGEVGCGTVFKITPSGKLKTLHRFQRTDGLYPYAGLVQATNGNFYGTTTEGGANTTDCGGFGCGTVFKITPSGKLKTLHSFAGYPKDGARPEAGLIQATNGNLYGTTQAGGANGSAGTVFKITPSGKLKTLYNFCSQSGCTDGSSPDAGLVQDTNGNLYGTTQGGGANSYGTVFTITTSGKLKTLHSFDSTDGAIPDAGLVQDINGYLYGTTTEGGANGEGSVFKLLP